jgi:dolichol-phosphate mannosyltransferase
MDQIPYISVVIPVYRCGEVLEELYERLCKSLSKISENFEIILVDDRSPDQAWENIKSLAKRDPRVRGIRLSKNFGQHYAITAGLDEVRGKWIVVMDCDLQDRPEEIPNLYHKAMEGYDVVVGKRAKRQDRFIKRLGSQLFYMIYNYLTDSEIDKGISNFGIYSRQVIESVKSLREHARSFGLFVIWTGFDRTEINIRHDRRRSGKSSYTLSKLAELAIDSIVTHSNKPLRLTVKMGFSLSLLSLFYAAWLIIRYLFWSTPVEGWTSLIVSIYFLAGLVLGSIGMLGLYIGKIFDEVKNRPLYIVQETTFEKSLDG